MKNIVLKSLLILLLLVNTAFAAAPADPLPSWNDTATKKAIITFVEEVTRPGSPSFVPVAERIATFDNDGTLWPEQPMYFPEAFLYDRIKALVPQHPEWQNKQPFKAVLEGDQKTIYAGGNQTLLELIYAMHDGYTTEEFAQAVKDWAVTAKHPKTGRLYTEMAYQPMHELLDYLRMVLRPSSYPAAGPISCAPGRKGSMVFPPSR